MALTLPVIVRELEYFIESFPLYIHRLHTLADDANRPWLSKLVGQGLGEAERSFGDLTALASNWAGTFLRSIWSGGRALISMLSLAVVTPIVASYLLYHWNSMIAAIDNWIPPARRETVRALARDIDDTIGGFVRGQSTLCLVLAVFYGVILWLIGLKHGALIGFVAGVVSFVPYIGSLSGLVVSTCIAIAQFWPDWTSILLVPAVFFYWTIASGLCFGTVLGSPACASQSSVGDFRTVRLRLSFRLCGPRDRSSGRGRYRCRYPLCIAAILREPVLRVGFVCARTGK